MRHHPLTPGILSPLGLLTLAAVAWTAGCASLQQSLPPSWIPGAAEEPETPFSVAVVWSNAQLQRPDGPASRGFGGRLMFHGRDGDTPIRVDGTLVVYAFDELRRDPKNSKPDRKYVFTRQQFAEHYSKSDIGHSYSVWIPWDQIGGPQQQVSLIVRFNPVDAAPVVGAQTKLTLPGPTPPETAFQPEAAQPTDATRQTDDGSPHRVRPVAYYTPMPPRRIGDSANGSKRQMATTTISLPRGSDAASE